MEEIAENWEEMEEIPSFEDLGLELNQDFGTGEAVQSVITHQKGQTIRIERGIWKASFHKTKWVEWDVVEPGKLDDRLRKFKATFPKSTQFRLVPVAPGTAKEIKKPFPFWKRPKGGQKDGTHHTDTLVGPMKNQSLGFADLCDLPTF